MPKIVGQTIPVRRMITGLNTLDRAFNVKQERLGIPIGVGWEIFAPTHTGKSTFVYSLSSLIAADQNKDWLLCDLEGFDPEFLGQIAEYQGMKDKQTIQVCDGTTHSKTTYATATDEKLLDEFVEYFHDDNFCAGVVDSLATISPLSEQEGEHGEANMGRRARIIAQLTRKSLKVLRKDDSPTLFGVNHYMPLLGQHKAWATPGGEVKNYLFTVRVRLQQLKKDRYEDGSYILNGYVNKNRWGGGIDNLFSVFIQSGMGIHKGLTAVLDCKRLGLIKNSGNSFKLGDKSYQFKPLRDKWDDPEVFQPFHDALDKYNQENE